MVCVCVPWAPAERRGGEVGGEAGGHFGLEFGDEALGVGHDGFGVLLFLLHVNVHVAHGHFVVEARHPAVGIFP